MKPFYTITEISAIIKKSQSFLYRSAKLGKLQVKKKTINGKEITIVEADALQKFLKENFDEQSLPRGDEQKELVASNNNFCMTKRIFDEQKELLTSIKNQVEFLQSRDTKTEIKEALQEIVDEQKRFLVLRYDEKYREMEARIKQSEREKEALIVENERLKNWWKFWKKK